jgi:glycosyltransferase involved in cell wall biosynthesis
MTVAFYLNNKGIKGVNCKNIMQGNPGIGGSEFATILLTQYLSENYKDRYDIIVFSEDISCLPDSIVCRKIENINDALTQAHTMQCSLFVLRYDGNTDFIRRNEFPGLKFIIWCHNFVQIKDLNFYSKQKNVVALVCVGREQLDKYRDHNVFKKSTFIYNGYPVKPYNHYNNSKPLKERKSVVTYAGNLIPSKGFHKLAKAWPIVVQNVPDATLNVIGSGKLYNRAVKLGKFGLAEKNYENYFIKYLLNERGELFPSVVFHGILGAEKEEILKTTKAGVPNPSGKTETFGYTAVEMQLMGANVTSVKCPGYMDTFYDKSMLYKNSKGLSKNIIALLKNSQNDYKKTYDFIYDNFSINIVSRKWIELFLILEQGGQIKSMEIINSNYNLKYLREINRKIKNCIPFGEYLPPIIVYEKYITKIKNGFSKIFNLKKY